MDQYKVTGMSCAACAARVEKAVNAVEGVTSCSVSLLTNSMGVEGSASANHIIKAVEDAGYGASLKSAPQESEGQSSMDDAREMLEDHETPALLKRLLWSVGFLAVLMYLSMGVHMWGWWVPEVLSHNHVALGILQMLLAGIIMVINQKFFISGAKSALHLSPNMDTLVAMGSGISFLWSTFILLSMATSSMHGDQMGAMELMGQLYFESAAMIVTLITVGKMLEARSKGKTTDALKSLMKLAPQTANILEDGKEKTVPIRQVKKGDIFIVRPGESIPVDGIVKEGSGAVNESALSGESIPVDKKEGDEVSAATINMSGLLKCEATRVGEDTTLSRIIRMVADAQATKAPIAKVADKVSGVFVPAVIGIALVTTILWLIVGKDMGFALARGISVLVISCPCALGLATPVAIMVGSGMGAKNGILFKNAVSLEQTARTKIVVLDKTGTITEGDPRVRDMVPAEGVSEKELLLKAAAMERYSEHPLAKAILNKAEEMGLTVPEAENFKALVGAGVTAVSAGENLMGGSWDHMRKAVSLEKEEEKKLLQIIEKLSSEGKTPLCFAKDGQWLGVIAVADVIKADSAEAIRELKNQGIRTVMLTGDNHLTAAAIAKEAGVDGVISGVRPDEKEAVIRELKTLGLTVMVGDGINDAPALTSADIGMAIGAGSDTAIDAAGVVLMKSTLKDVSAAVRLSRKTLKNIYENLFWAFFYNVICIPVAAGAWIALTGWEMNPMLGAAAMSLSSFCVVTNALRLNLFKAKDAAKDRRQRKEVSIEDLTQIIKQHYASDTAFDKKTEKEGTTMYTTTIKVEGMMCPHCEARVNNAVKEAFEVISVESSHTASQTVITSEKPLDAAKVAEVITKAGYNAQA